MGEERTEEDFELLSDSGDDASELGFDEDELNDVKDGNLFSFLI